MTFGWDFTKSLTMATQLTEAVLSPYFLPADTVVTVNARTGRSVGFLDALHVFQLQLSLRISIGSPCH